MPSIRSLRANMVTVTMTAAAIAIAAGTVSAQSWASADPGGAVRVSGEFASTDFQTPGTSTVTADGVEQVRGWSFVGVWEASDPRLSGDVTYVRNYDEYPGSGGLAAESGRYHVSNDGGSWTASSNGIVGPGLPTSDSIVLVGEDGYAGLTAWLMIDSEAFTFEGAIVPGPMPEAPTDQ